MLLKMLNLSVSEVVIVQDKGDIYMLTMLLKKKKIKAKEEVKYTIENIIIDAFTNNQSV